MIMKTDIQDAFLLGVSCAKYIGGIEGDLSAPAIDVLQQIVDNELTLVDSPSEMSSKFQCPADETKQVVEYAASEHRFAQRRLALIILERANAADDGTNSS